MPRKPKKRCKFFKSKEQCLKENCGNCRRWDGKKCKREADLLAMEQKKHSKWEHMMRENRGVWME